jgi:hypothetical protein
VNFSYNVADEKTHGPLHQIDVLNDPDLLIASCDSIHDQILFEGTKNGHVEYKSVFRPFEPWRHLIGRRELMMAFSRRLLQRDSCK